MLILTRRVGESIVINDEITLVVMEFRGNGVRLGIDAPTNVSVHRKEVSDAIKRENRKHSTAPPTSAPPTSAPLPRTTDLTDGEKS